MAFKKLSKSQLAIVASPLPDIDVNTTFAVKGPSEYRWALTSSQISEWPEFTDDVRRKTKRRGGPSGNVQHTLQIRTEKHLVGNEGGLQGRFVQQVSQEMSEIFDSLKMKARIGDLQTGIHCLQKKGAGAYQPDLIISDGLRQIRVVGEIKTFWTFMTQKEPWDEFLATKFGQIGVYMDFYNCQYGFFTTYNETWIIRRTETNMFHYSPAIQSNHRSSPEEVSLREAFLFLGSVAGDANESYFRDSSVDKLKLIDRKPWKTVAKEVKSGRKRRRVEINEEEEVEDLPTDNDVPMGNT